MKGFKPPANPGGNASIPKQAPPVFKPAVAPPKRASKTPSSPTLPKRMPKPAKPMAPTATGATGAKPFLLR